MIKLHLFVYITLIFGFQWLSISHALIIVSLSADFVLEWAVEKYGTLLDIVFHLSFQSEYFNFNLLRAYCDPFSP